MGPEQSGYTPSEIQEEQKDQLSWWDRATARFRKKGEEDDGKEKKGKGSKVKNVVNATVAIGALANMAPGNVNAQVNIPNDVSPDQAIVRANDIKSNAQQPQLVIEGDEELAKRYDLPLVNASASVDEQSTGGGEETATSSLSANETNHDNGEDSKDGVKATYQSVSAEEGDPSLPPESEPSESSQKPPEQQKAEYMSVNVPQFDRTWERTDKPVADGRVQRTWMWGPAPISPVMQEDGKTVIYFDKSRMELAPGNQPPWDVTNGLLVRDLIFGKMEVAPGQFVDKGGAPEINISGDPNDPNAPTYRTFSKHTAKVDQLARGSDITARIDRAGNVTYGEPAHGVKASEYVSETGHNIPDVFWKFMTSEGLVSENGEYKNEQLMENPYYATGFPITEAFWTDVKIGGVTKRVLVQAFERRVLTYNPENEDGWKVEAGNVGQHYYEFKYGVIAPLIGNRGGDSSPSPEQPQAGEEFISHSGEGWGIQYDKDKSPVKITPTNVGELNKIDDIIRADGSLPGDAKAQLILAESVEQAVRDFGLKSEEFDDFYYRGGPAIGKIWGRNDGNGEIRRGPAVIVLKPDALQLVNGDIEGLKLTLFVNAAGQMVGGKPTDKYQELQKPIREILVNNTKLEPNT